MREESLLCQFKRRFMLPGTTDPQHGFTTYPNLLADAVLDGHDQAWVADITYIRLPANFDYLACLLDALPQRCVGWKLSRQIDTSITRTALEMALRLALPAPKLINHSDRVVRYVSTEYVARLE